MALWRLLGYQGGWIWEKLGPPLKQAQTCIAPLENPRWTVRSCCCCFRTRSWLGVSEGRGGSVARQLLAKLSRGGGAAWRPSDASRGGGVASMWQLGARGGASWCGPGSGAAPRLSRASFGGAVEGPRLVSVSRRAVHHNMNEAEGLRQRRPVRPQVLTEENAAQAVKDSRCVGGLCCSPGLSAFPLPGEDGRHHRGFRKGRRFGGRHRLFPPAPLTDNNTVGGPRLERREQFSFRTSRGERGGGGEGDSTERDKR